MTNDLLKKNAEALKLGTIETAKESQRGVVDIETLQQTNKLSLIHIFDYAITNNGACVVDRDGAIIAEHPMTNEEMYALVDFCEDYN